MRRHLYAIALSAVLMTSSAVGDTEDPDSHENRPSAYMCRECRDAYDHYVDFGNWAFNAQWRKLLDRTVRR